MGPCAEWGSVWLIAYAVIVSVFLCLPPYSPPAYKDWLIELPRWWPFSFWCSLYSCHSPVSSSSLTVPLSPIPIVCCCNAAINNLCFGTFNRNMGIFIIRNICYYLHFLITGTTSRIYLLQFGQTKKIASRSFLESIQFWRLFFD